MFHTDQQNTTGARPGRSVPVSRHLTAVPARPHGRKQDRAGKAEGTIRRSPIGGEQERLSSCLQAAALPPYPSLCVPLCDPAIIGHVWCGGEAHLACSCFARASLRVFSLCSVRCAVMRFACADAIVDVPKCCYKRIEKCRCASRKMLGRSAVET